MERRVVISPQVITPYTDAVLALDGDRVTLSCNYSSGNYLQWYRHYLKSAPQLLVMEYMPGKTPGFTLNHDKKAKSMELEISSAEVTDSALYYCALNPTVTGNPEILYKNGMRGRSYQQAH
uniref:Ig-like domain-containing protein n=1 Tax=Oncorhynchus tshawytscha TaxID=74940 RepID=A0A8C8CQV6_ONCTS